MVIHTGSSAADIRRLFDGFSGQWDIVRTISNGARFEGSAIFTPETDNVLQYLERGILKTADDNALESYRCFTYGLKDAEIQIFFKDPIRNGALYVALRPQKTGNHFVASDRHDCGDDHYWHTVKWLSASAFHTDIRVKGPQKDYAMQTVYSKCA